MSTPPMMLDLLDTVTAPVIADAEALSSVARAHFDRVRRIFADDNIIGAGVARKVSDDRRTDTLSLVFYVREKHRAADLPHDHMLPPVMAAADGRAVFTDVVELGDIVPEAAPVALADAKVQRTPLASGFSVGHRDVTAGTLGAVVRKDGKLYLLSNSHVLANSGLGKAGDAVLYPGPADDGVEPGDIAARLSAFTPFEVGNGFSNAADAALAEIDPGRLGAIDPAIFGATLPLTVATPVRDMVVRKRGRTSGDTESVVRDVDFRILTRYDGVGIVGFTGQVLCDRYTLPGDSGALVVADSGAIVGLHFAGSPQGSVFTPIATVVAALKFEFG